jgi:hypothetical protein
MALTLTSFPWAGTSPGSAGPYTNAQFAAFQQALYNRGGNPKDSGVAIYSNPGTAPSGTLLGFGLDVTAQAVPNMSVNVAQGGAVINGYWAQESASTNTLSITSNASGNPRIDTVVLHLDTSLQTVVLQANAGTPGATPAPPALTQSGTIWEIPLADIAVASGAVSIAQSNITPRQVFANMPDGVYVPIYNNSGVALQTGDVVVWDSSAAQAVKTSTTANDLAVAGVVVGRIAIGGTGMILTRGFGWVNASAAVTRGNVLVQSTTAKQAANPTVASAPIGVFGYATQTSGSAGLVTAYIDASYTQNLNLNYAINNRSQGFKTLKTQYSTSSNTFVDVDAANAIITLTLTGTRVMFFAGFNYVTASNVAGNFNALTVIANSTTYPDNHDSTTGLASMLQNGTATLYLLAKFTSLTPGSNTFKLQWKAGVATGSAGIGAGTAQSNLMNLLAWEF